MNTNILNISSFVFLLLVATSWSVPVDTDSTDGGETTTQRSDMMDDTDHHGHSSQHELKLQQDDIKGSVVCSAEHKNLTWTPEFKEKISPCMDPKVYGTEEGLKNPNCQFFCQGHAVGILDEHGMATKDLYDQFIDLAMPEKYVAAAKEHVHKCLDDLASKVDPKDAMCEGAGELQKCICKTFAVDCE